MAKLEIQIHTRKMLKPSTPTPNHLRTLKLSLFDQLAPPLYVPVLLHYLPTTTEIVVCDKLQKSLAQTLTKFYPLAGRFISDSNIIHCNDEGVEYVETKVNADLAEFLHQGPKIEILNHLLPTDMSSCPLLGIQVNIFNCGGLVMGIQMSHIIADGFTYSTFVKEWARICQTGTTKGCLPSFGQLSSLFPTRVLSVAQFSPPPNVGGPHEIVTRRFLFDALAIAKLKNTIHDSSRVVLIMSLIWKVLVAISSDKNGHSRDSSLVFPINLRGKTSNSLSLEHAMGNCGIFGIANLEASQSRKELNDFVNLVGNTIRDTSIGIGNASVDDIPSLVLNNHTKVVDKLGQGDEMDVYLCPSWCRFPWYEADFGWGKPFCVRYVNYDAYEVIILMDTKDGDGVEAWISLKENVMAEFETHVDILTFCPPLPK